MCVPAPAGQAAAGARRQAGAARISLSIPGPGPRSGTSQPSSHAAGHRGGDMELLCVTVNTVSCQDSIRDEDAGETASGHLLLCLKLIFIPL